MAATLIINAITERYKHYGKSSFLHRNRKVLQLLFWKFFVKYITNSKGEVVYKNPEETRSVFRSDTSYLITDMLKTCAKTGTARKLAELPYEVDFFSADKTCFFVIS